MITNELDQLVEQARECANTEEISRLFNCECAQTTICKRVNSGGALTYVNQCGRCGKASAAIKTAHLTIEQRRLAREFNEDLRDGFNEAWSEACKQLRERVEQARRDELQAQNDEWRQQHAALINSQKWKIMRERVFERCRGTCEACGVNHAREVHHIHYRFPLGQEPLWVLRGVCRDCHDRLYKLKTRD